MLTNAATGGLVVFTIFTWCIGDCVLVLILIARVLPLVLSVPVLKAGDTAASAGRAAGVGAAGGVGCPTAAEV